MADGDIRDIVNELLDVWKEESGREPGLKTSESLGKVAQRLEQFPKDLSQEMAKTARTFAETIAGFRGESTFYRGHGWEGIAKSSKRVARNANDYLDALERIVRHEMSAVELEELRNSALLERQLVEKEQIDLLDDQKERYLDVLETVEKITANEQRRIKIEERIEELGIRINRDLFKRKTLIAAGVGFLDRMVSTVADMRQETGATIAQTRELAGVGIGGMAQALGRGVLLSPREAAQVVATLAAHTQTIGQVTATTVANVAELQQRFGLSADEAARLIGELVTLPGFTGESTSHMITFADNLAQAMDLSPAKVMREMASSAGIFAAHGSSAAESLTRAAAESVRMGTTLEQVEGFADRLVGDVEGTIEGFMRLRTMGIDLGDPLELMQLAEAGETGKLGRRLAERLQAQGFDLNIRSLNRTRARALEGVLGFDIAQLQRMAEGVDDLATETDVAAAATEESRSAQDKLKESTLNLAQRTNEAVTALATFAVSLHASAGNLLGGAGAAAAGRGGGGAAGRFGKIGAGAARGLSGAGIGLGVGAVTPFGNTAAAGIGGALGGIAGSFIPGVGTIIGSVAGALIAEGVVEAYEAIAGKEEEKTEERNRQVERKLDANQKAIVDALRNSRTILVSRHGDIMADTMLTDVNTRPSSAQINHSRDG